MATERSVLVRLRANADQFQREMVKARAAVKSVRDEIDTTNDRTAWLAQGFLALGPALAPLGAVAVPLLTGVATQATLAVGAVGTLAVAFNGVGDALGALNDYQLEPTVKNLEKLQQAMQKIGPDGAEFVRKLDEAGARLAVLGMDARAGMFPGMTEGIDAVLTRLPELRSVVTAIAEAIGQLSADAGRGLASDEFDGFFEFLATDGKTILVDTGRALGNLFDGFASMLSAFAPLTREMSVGLLDLSRSFEQWAEGLAGSGGFAEFVEYVEHAGPMLLDLFGSLVNALVQFGQAAAPVADILVPALTAVVDLLAQVADTPLGSLLLFTAALTSLYGRLAALNKIAGSGILGRATGGFRDSAKAARASVPTFSELGTVMYRAGQSAEYASKQTTAARASVSGFARAAGPAAAQLALLGSMLTGVADGAGLTNTAMGGLLGGTLGGAKAGVLGLTVGFLADVYSNSTSAAASIREMDAAIESLDVDKMNAELDQFNAKFGKYLDGDDTFGDFVSGAFNVVTSLGAWGDELAKGMELQQAHDQAVRLAAEAQAAYSTALGDGGRAAFEAKYGLDALIDSMLTQQEVARGALDAQFAWGQAVQDIRDLVKDGSNGFNEFTEAGQDNFAAISSAADALNKMVEAGDLTNREYVRLRKQFIEFARDLGAGKREAEGFANELLDFPDTLAPQIAIQFDKQQLQEAKAAFLSLPREVRTAIRADGIPQTEAAVEVLVRKYQLTEKERRALITLKDSASPTIQAILSRLRQVRDKQITVTTTWQNVYRGPQRDPSREGQGLGLLGPRFTGSADGSTVPKTGLPYRDRHPYLLADGEEVVSNRRGQADLFRPVLKGINRGLSRSAIKAMLADGGTAGEARPRFEYQRTFTPSMMPAAAAGMGELGALRGDLARLAAEVAGVRSAVDRGTAVNAGEHATDRASQRSGASVAAMSKSRGYLSR